MLPSSLLVSWLTHLKTRPQHCAVWELGDGGRVLTWHELFQEAETLAVQIRAAGVPPGGRVALCLSAGASWVAAVWAVWACNAVWCPIPPSIPKDLARERLAHLDPHAIWDGHSLIACQPQTPPCSLEAAYLIHTSGSTGVPKGVLVGTAGLPGLWQAQAALFGTTASSRVAWMLSPAFDASVSDVGVALTSGATLYVVPSGRWKRWEAWASDIQAHHITQVDAPPSWLALWSRKSPPSCLETIVAGGEPTPIPILQAWSHRLRWVNVYGPTEATVCSSAHRRHVAPDEQPLPTLGTPLPGIGYRLQPPGVDRPDAPEVDEGELWIGGNAVALGYWQDPANTAYRFADHDGQRWFRTGDAVMRQGEEWIFLGRLDRQVKRNGQMLHLDGVETVLSSHPEVGNVVVYIDPQDHLVVEMDVRVSEMDKVKAWAKTRLPAWGIPRRWEVRTEWPQTPTGKVDRKKVIREAFA